MTPYNPVTADPYLLQSTLGYRVTEWEVGRAVIELPLTQLHKNRNNIPHGGIYALLLDSVCGFCGTCQGPDMDSRTAVTLSLDCKFISLPKGDILIATGRKLGGGARSFFAEGMVHDETGHLIATGQAALQYRARPSSSEAKP